MANQNQLAPMEHPTDMFVLPNTGLDRKSVV